MQDKIRQYIQTALSEKPLAYQLGFLQSFLAEIMYNDSQHLHKFKDLVSKANDKANKKP